MEHKFHIRCAYFTPNCTWSPNYSVLVNFSNNIPRTGEGVKQRRITNWFIALKSVTSLTFPLRLATKKNGDPHSTFFVGGTGTITPESRNHFNVLSASSWKCNGTLWCWLILIGLYDGSSRFKCICMGSPFKGVILSASKTSFNYNNKESKVSFVKFCFKQGPMGWPAVLAVTDVLLTICGCKTGLIDGRAILASFVKFCFKQGPMGWPAVLAVTAVLLTLHGCKTGLIDGRAILAPFIAIFGSAQGGLKLTRLFITVGATFVKWTFAEKDGEIIPALCISFQAIKQLEDKFSATRASIPSTAKVRDP
jgi:hypothetical protein